MGSPALTAGRQLWALLDELAASDPHGYRRFVQRQLGQARALTSPPNPDLCLKTALLKPREETLFIALCGWHRVPAPKSATDPVPLRAGQLEEISDPAGSHLAVVVAYNADLLRAAAEDQAELDQLIRLAMRYVEERFQLTLGPSYPRAPFPRWGSPRRLEESLMGVREGVTQAKDRELGPWQLPNGGVSALPELLLPQGTTPAQGRGLIEEIPTAPQIPAHELTVVKDQDGRPLRIDVKVELAQVSSASECDLSVSEDDLVVEVPDRYRLQLDLPQPVDNAAATATFVPGKATLLVTVPVA
ncbi:PIH1 domain-containing protein 2 [Tachyglossus aculeatus]|uniref:PIH1 domain-containing protein 2 n=1 Tax=Tachyglossus aculeatus TaxID=9261 RepID=UPI0018F40AF2|nr:PIH1 domain-containing protein 2 [Tachyglossus aculeatus]XP_038609661.1 PIH1 domain-containing protein 2 [Tachyglossus aculeatus]XP_038609662.1 PIH1 domain-containing protein 2 [Tachyglossus aculeatus]XP_038609663.1 PIH1 domain-containing protein 2 [Tachyglossus aculeatus]